MATASISLWSKRAPSASTGEACRSSDLPQLALHQLHALQQGVRPLEVSACCAYALEVIERIEQASGQVTLRTHSTHHVRSRSTRLR
jgi:hypothetical protein